MRKFHKRYDYMIKLISQQIDLEDKTVVDCGCGEGDGTKMLAKVFGEVIGIDIDNECIRTAKKHVKNANFDLGSITKMKLEDNVADVFICSETLEHLKKAESKCAAQEIYRTCKAGAYICITVPENKKECLKKKGHKQFLSIKTLQTHFPTCELVSKSVFIKSPSRKGRGNLVALFRKDT